LSRSSGISPLPRRILVPIDGSDNSKRALYTAIALSKRFDAQLTIINVIPAPGLLVEAPAGLGLPPTGTEQYYEKQEKDASYLLDDATSVCKAAAIREATTEATRAYKSVVEEIIELATKRKIDLIVIGTRGLGGFRKLLLGSVSSGVVTHAHCNVLVVR
jgi:nucleotide-binding universal stress UspA family protein